MTLTCIHPSNEPLLNLAVGAPQDKRMSVISKLFGDRDANHPKSTARNPYQLQNAVAGFVCLEPQFESLMEADRLTLGPLFPSVRSSSQEILACHVLFLYCKIDKDGSLAGSKMRVRDFVKASGARVAIIASENDGQHYIRALQPKNDWPANIVLVIDRRGPAFTIFFKRLFDAMNAGTSMLMAWVELAPQNPADPRHRECPVTVLAAEAGHIALGRV
jgi:hypothetical protein